VSKLPFEDVIDLQRAQLEKQAAELAKWREKWKETECSCDCSTPCPLGKIASEPRCTNAELRQSLEKLVEIVRAWVLAPYPETDPKARDRKLYGDYLEWAREKPWRKK